MSFVRQRPEKATIILDDDDETQETEPAARPLSTICPVCNEEVSYCTNLDLNTHIDTCLTTRLLLEEELQDESQPQTAWRSSEENKTDEESSPAVSSAMAAAERKTPSLPKSPCNLRVSRTITEQVLQTARDEECVVCFEPYEAGQTISRLSCLCIFHKSCLQSWFAKSRTCPNHPDFSF